jgi:hypothetical protein
VVAAACHQLAGNHVKAQQHIAKTLNLLPNCTIDSCERIFSRKKEPRKRMIAALLDAGMPKSNKLP